MFECLWAEWCMSAVTHQKCVSLTVLLLFLRATCARAEHHQHLDSRRPPHTQLFQTIEREKFHCCSWGKWLVHIITLIYSSPTSCFIVHLCLFSFVLFYVLPRWCLDPAVPFSPCWIITTVRSVKFFKTSETCRLLVWFCSLCWFVVVVQLNTIWFGHG